MAILKVKDENGNIIPIPAIKGDKGDKGDPGFTREDIIDLVYPIGSYYWSNDPTSPAELFGGDWTAINSDAAAYCWRRVEIIVNDSFSDISDSIVIAENKSLILNREYTVNVKLVVKDSRGVTQNLEYIEDHCVFSDENYPFLFIATFTDARYPQGYVNVKQDGDDIAAICGVEEGCSIVSAYFSIQR